MYEAHIYRNEWDFLHDKHQSIVYVDHMPKPNGNLVKVDYTWGILSLIFNFD